ncbi:type II toxin-antitoxin system RatA family toxin [Nitrososphaera sp.]|uniref:type II toxin-antitoxin system RatA family toxin n=1 Tax=Nitrososphaera sp. TaxID=1971748 RepID=UPI002EDB9369
MTTVNASREIAAPLDRVWAIVSDVDNEAQYWHGTKAVKNISREGNVIKREVVIAFKDSKTMQKVTLNPQTSIETKITEGPITGTRLVTLSGVGSRTKVDVAWDFKLAGLLSVFSVMVRKHITEGTEQALERIARAVE